MKPHSLLVGVAVVAVASLVVLPGFAWDYSGTTESASSQYEVLYITVALNSTQYADVVASDIEYHTVTEIGAQDRTVSYVIHPTATVSYGGKDIGACPIATFNVTMTSSEDMPEYDFQITCTSGDVSSDYMYYLYWEDESDGTLNRTLSFTASELETEGIEIEDLQSENIEIRLYVGAGSLDSAPSKAFDEVVLGFTAAVEGSP